LRDLGEEGDNVEIDLTERSYGVVDWIHLLYTVNMEVGECLD